MYRKSNIVLFFALVSLACFATGEGQLHASDNRPNILIIFTDDHGYGDVGCYGNKVIKTPNLQRLAAWGMFFTRAYIAAPICNPSRMELNNITTMELSDISRAIVDHSVKIHQKLGPGLSVPRRNADKTGSRRETGPSVFTTVEKRIQFTVNKLLPI